MTLMPAAISRTSQLNDYVITGLELHPLACREWSQPNHSNLQFAEEKIKSQSLKNTVNITAALIQDEFCPTSNYERAHSV